MIQINKEWRIREGGGVFHLEERVKGNWKHVEDFSGASNALASYVTWRVSELYPLGTPQALLTLLRKLTDEIEACVKEVGK